MKIDIYSPTIRRREMDAVLTALVEDRIGPGEQGRALIQIAKERLEFDFALALRSPAIALRAALGALGLEDGQGVAVSALSPRYYAAVLDELRLTPLYCDVTPSSPVMTRETVEQAIENRPEGLDVRAVVLPHTLGFVPDAAAVASLSLPVIEDCSHSFGSRAGDRPAGSVGSLTILGLEERDMLTAGGGALLYAASRRDAAALRGLGEFPPEYALPDMNAAMGVVQFREAGRNLGKRAEIARVYAQSALRTRHGRFVQETIAAPDTAAPADGEAAGTAAGDAAESGGGYNNYAFPLVLETGMKDVEAYARRKEIVVEAAFRDTLMGTGFAPPASCPAAYSLSLRTCLFPLYPRLTAAEVERVSRLILTLP